MLSMIFHYRLIIALVGDSLNYGIAIYIFFWLDTFMLFYVGFFLCYILYYTYTQFISMYTLIGNDDFL